LRSLTNRTCRSDAQTPRRCPAVKSVSACAASLALAASLIHPASAATAQDSSADPPLLPPDCKATSAILVDAATGTVLWEKNCRQRRAIASTTKIMTATLMLESGRLDEEVAFSENARKTEYANLNAKPGEKFSMRDLLYAIMLRSSNDGCVAVAEHLAGSVPRFAQQMTGKAQDIGAVDTNFVTPNGLYHPQHYSTAYDMALITRYAIRNPLFNDVVGSKSKVIDRTLNPKDCLVQNHNKFLARYPGADGIKTGYVRQSGKCLVASATALEAGNPWRLIAVVLNSGDTYGDSARLMDWGKTNFQPLFFARRGEQLGEVRVAGGDRGKVSLVAADDLVAIVRRDSGKNGEREIRVERDMRAPVAQAQVGGKVTALIGGRPVAVVDLVAAEPVSQTWAASMAPWTGWTMALSALFWGRRYARAFTKGAGRRRRRFQARSGEPDCVGESNG
jgi:serine-type D-Ala-D-Ala carboxypeptidase (penicillin-binding protein 5/6)